MSLLCMCLSVSVEEQGINSDVALVYVCLWRNKGLTVMSLLCMCLSVSVEEQGINSDVALVYVSLCVCGGTRD